MLKNYYAATVYRAAEFAVGMSTTDAEALCLALNAGRDATNSNCFFNGAVIVVNNPGSASLTASPGNWIVMMPDSTMAVHADADFAAAFVAQ
jgi:hypothetical protein